ncbi:MAG: MlaD family protein [Vicingaceae bacterium]
MQIKKEVKVGIVAVLAIFLFVWGYNFLKGTNIFSNSNNMYAVYDQVGGLKVSAPIHINGVQVGIVKEKQFLNDNSGKVLITLSMEETNLKIPKDSKARLVTDFLGTASIDIMLGNSKEPLSKGDTINTEIERTLTEEVNQQILPLKKKAEELLSSIDTVMNIITAILDEKTRNNVSGAFEKINNTIKHLESTAKRIDLLIDVEADKISGITSDVKNITGTISKNSKQLDKSMKNLAAITDSISAADLTQTINNAKVTLDQTAALMKKINEGEGTMGKLVNSDSLYNNLDAASKDLDLLLIDLKKNPGRYVHFSIFGRRDKNNK